jgi:hypothetical protein
MEQLAALRCPFRLTPETTEEIPAEYTAGLIFCQNTMEPDSVPWIGYYAPYRTACIAVANAYSVWFEISREHSNFRANRPARYSLQTKNWPSDGINMAQLVDLGEPIPTSHAPSARAPSCQSRHLGCNTGHTAGDLGSHHTHYLSYRTQYRCGVQRYGCIPRCGLDTAVHQYHIKNPGYDIQQD